MNFPFKEDRMLKRKTKRQEPTPGWVTYLRTSDKEAQNPANSQARQRAAIQRMLLDRSDLPFIEEYVDNFTGRIPKRSAYQRMLADAREGKFSFVAVENAERFGRNDAEALMAIEELHELGVSVRFADYPERDPVDPDDRILIGLSFSLARRESLKTGQRVVGGMHTKVKRGGCMSRAPEGYINREERTDKADKLDHGRYTRWVEPHPTQFKVIREAFDLLLTDRMTLDDICEELHARGYTFRSGRPFVKIHPNGQRKPAKNAISRIFHRWFYAGWVESEAASIVPKTLRGNWEPMVTTEEFERAQEILAQRNEFRQAKRKHQYLLRGMVYLRFEDGSLRRLNCQTPNTARKHGGTPYYCIPSSSYNFACGRVDAQVEAWITHIQVDPQFLPAIRAAYTKDTDQFFGRPTADEHAKLQAKLKSIDEEEQRTLRLVAKGMVTDENWNVLWREWQDLRRKIADSLEALNQRCETHIASLDHALAVISRIGVVYKQLSFSDRRELLRLAVKRVILNQECEVVDVELQPPFAYLRDLGNAVRGGSNGSPGVDGAKSRQTKTRRVAGSQGVPFCVPRGIRTPDFLLRRQALYPLSYRHISLC